MTRFYSVTAITRTCSIVPSRGQFTQSAMKIFVSWGAIPLRFDARAQTALSGGAIEIRKDFDAAGGSEAAETFEDVPAGFRIPLTAIERNDQRAGPIVAQ